MKILVLPPHANSNDSQMAYGIAASQPDRTALVHHPPAFLMLRLCSGFGPKFDVNVTDVHDLKSACASNCIDEDVDWVVDLGFLEEADLDALWSHLDVVAIPMRFFPDEQSHALSTWQRLELRREAQGGAIPFVVPSEIHLTDDADFAWKPVMQMREKWRREIGRFPRMLPPPFLRPPPRKKLKEIDMLPKTVRSLTYDGRQIFEGCQWLREEPDMRWDEIQRRWGLLNKRLLNKRLRKKLVSNI